MAASAWAPIFAVMLGLDLSAMADFFLSFGQLAFYYPVRRPCIDANSARLEPFRFSALLPGELGAVKFSRVIDR